MNKKIEHLKYFRQYLLKQLAELSPEQLNAIPATHRNNIIWNLGHLIAVQQNLCYRLAGLPLAVDDQYCTPYLPGTAPEGFRATPEIERIKALLITSLDQLQADFATHQFTQYSPSVTIPKVYGVTVNNIDEALDYLLYHEGLHAGYVLALKHLV